MIESKNAAANTVKAVGQIDVNKFVSIYKRGGTKRVRRRILQNRNRLPAYF